jgi:gas vesicle protein
MTKNAKVALGVFGALAAGVLIGLLVAPEKGKDLRVRIKKNTDKLTDQLSHLFTKAEKDDMKSEIKDKVNRAKEAIS